MEDGEGSAAAGAGRAAEEWRTGGEGGEAAERGVEKRQRQRRGARTFLDALLESREVGVLVDKALV